MLDHVTVAVTNFDRSRAFYDAVLATLDIRRLYADGDRAAGYGRNGKAFFWIAQQDHPPTRTHIAFAAPSRAAIANFHKTALTHGGIDNGAPGPRREYHDDYFAAFVLDPDGNGIEAVIQ